MTTQLLGAAAIGGIDPNRRISAGELTQPQLDSFIARLQDGSLFAPLNPAQTLPCKCKDGRPRKDGTCPLAPNAAGGTFSLVAADLLSAQTFKAGNTADYASNIIEHLAATGYRSQLGDHTSDDTHGGSGCGALDKFGQIIAFIAQNGDVLRTMANSLGIQANADDHRQIIARATQPGVQISTGVDMLHRLTNVAGNQSAEVLTGNHQEVAAVINFKPHTTLNRAAVRAATKNMQAFNVDAWSFATAAAALSANETTQRQAVLAMTYFNLATACVLAGPGLRVVVRR